MTYEQFLVLFLIAPIAVLWLGLRKRLDRARLKPMATLALVAAIYTTPWDNAIVALGVWEYESDRIWGVVIGYVPLEEYLFFVLQTIMTSLLVVLGAELTRRGRWWKV